MFDRRLQEIGQISSAAAVLHPSGTHHPSCIAAALELSVGKIFDLHTRAKGHELYHGDSLLSEIILKQERERMGLGDDPVNKRKLRTLLTDLQFIQVAAPARENPELKVDIFDVPVNWAAQYRFAGCDVIN